MRHRVLLSTTVGATSLLLAACGSSSSTSGSTSPSVSPTPSAFSTASDADVAATKQAMKTALLKGATDGSLGVPLDAAGAQCVADPVVDRFGLTKISQLGLAKSSSGSVTMAQPDAEFLAAKLVDCAPNNGAVTTLQEKFNQGLGTKATDAQKACMDKVINRDSVIALLSSGFAGQISNGQAEFRAAVQAAIPGCGLGS